jgi:methylated-DNA-[protein]-cysteine S-methyltransferase
MPLDCNGAGPASATSTHSTAALSTPIGRILCRWRGGSGEPVVTAVTLVAEGDDAAEAPVWLQRAFAQYFDDPNRRIALRTAVEGTDFQRAVWRLIAAIPVGSTRTYGELAAELGSAPRAVGGACRANPVPLIVPCHRVVGKTGLGGFAGDTGGRLREIKRRLLAHEGSGDRG